MEYTYHTSSCRQGQDLFLKFSCFQEALKIFAEQAKKECRLNLLQEF